MSLDVIPKFDQMRNAALIQILERAWPECGAHNKAGKVLVKPMMAPAVELEMRASISGWNAAMDWAREQMVSVTPFGEPGLRGSRAADLPHGRVAHPGSTANPGSAGSARRDPRRAAGARAALESLFDGGRDHATK